jgi:hypothetical protein
VLSRLPSLAAVSKPASLRARTGVRLPCGSRDVACCSQGLGQRLDDRQKLFHECGQSGDLLGQGRQAADRLVEVTDSSGQATNRGGSRTTAPLEVPTGGVTPGGPAGVQFFGVLSRSSPSPSAFLASSARLPMRSSKVLFFRSMGRSRRRGADHEIRHSYSIQSDPCQQDRQGR